MKLTPTHLKKAFLYFAIASSFIACKKDDETKISLRPTIDYSKLTDTVSYSKGNKLFVDANGQTTLDLTSGNTRYKMFQAVNAYAGAGTTVQLDANVLKNMYNNTGTPFTGTYASLNSTGIQLRNAIASSKSATEAEKVHAYFEANFVEMAAISLASGATASNGVAGKLGTRLVSAKGMETVQIIQKSLIGALQLDYIGNVLLNTGLTADNYTIVSGKNSTKLEQNWDEAYGLLTVKPIYLSGYTINTTPANLADREGFIGSYIWEYGKPSDDANYNYSKIFPAFLKGRAAIVNNDMAELKNQATIIRTTIEKSIARAAVGYLTKWAARTTDADKAHDIGEGAGFIYSLRFCSIHNADAAFSDGILTGLLSSPGGFWDLTPAKVNIAKDAIKAKFNF